ncbi:hypothetical protein [Arthrobacter psychrolactophilus]
MTHKSSRRGPERDFAATGPKTQRADKAEALPARCVAMRRY